MMVTGGKTKENGQNAGDAQGEKTAAAREGTGRKNQWWLWDGEMEEVVRTPGMPRGRRRRRYGREWEGKTSGGYGTGKWRKWSERWGCPGGEDGGMGGTLKGLGKEDSG